MQVAPVLGEAVDLPVRSTEVPQKTAWYIQANYFVNCVFMKHLEPPQGT